MNDWIEWACRHELGTPERLTLVLIASTANTAGVALRHATWLREMTGASLRTLQRHIKTLRDAGLIEERGDWLVLVAGEGLQGELDPDQLGTPAPGPVTHSASKLDRLQESIDSLARIIARRLLPDGDHELDPAPEPEPPEPPPDPILTDPLYLALIEEGADPDLAYRVASRRSNLGEDPAELESSPPVQNVENIQDREESMLRVLSLLHHDPLTQEQWQGLRDEYRPGWMALVAAENKHSVKGEADAFSLLYPAILDAAEAWPYDPIDFMDAAVSTDPRVVKPWDRSIAQTPADDAELERDIAGMLADLRKVNHPSCAVHGRASEKDAAGVVHKEPIQAYHKRVHAKWQQMQKLQSMGVI